MDLRARRHGEYRRILNTDSDSSWQLRVSVSLAARSGGSDTAYTDTDSKFNTSHLLPDFIAIVNIFQMVGWAVLSTQVPYEYFLTM